MKGPENFSVGLRWEKTWRGCRENGPVTRGRCDRKIWGLDGSRTGEVPKTWTTRVGILRPRCRRTPTTEEKEVQTRVCNGGVSPGVLVGRILWGSEPVRDRIGEGQETYLCSVK